jgi:hypothetical protein
MYLPAKSPRRLRLWTFAPFDGLCWYAMRTLRSASSAQDNTGFFD